VPRKTAQRELLLELIREATGHLDANELYRQARQRQPRLSLSTVYRGLRLFKELGLVEGHQLRGDRRHYETTPETGHHHLVCLGCGHVTEFSCPLTERLKDRFMREQGFEVTEAEVRLAGYGRECRKRLTGSEATSTGQSRERG
jgi:Fe2+ or Zn2+ uptake regulation protein